MECPNIHQNERHTIAQQPRLPVNAAGSVKSRPVFSCQYGGMLACGVFGAKRKSWEWPNCLCHQTLGTSLLLRTDVQPFDVYLHNSSHNTIIQLMYITLRIELPDGKGVTKEKRKIALSEQLQFVALDQPNMLRFQRKVKQSGPLPSFPRTLWIAPQELVLTTSIGPMSGLSQWKDL